MCRMLVIKRMPHLPSRFPQVTCSRGVRLVADTLIADAGRGPWDAVALPGGMPGAERLRDCEALTEIVTAQLGAGRTLGAICAAPQVVLDARGLLGGRKATAHPAFSGKLTDSRRVGCERGWVGGGEGSGNWEAAAEGSRLDCARTLAHPPNTRRHPMHSAAASRVVVDGPLITSRGPGTALEFALALVAALYGQPAADAVAGPMVVAPGGEAPLVVK